MSEHQFKMRADTPRIVRSPLLADDGTSYFIPGVQFEDGRSRLITGVVVSPALQEDIFRALDESDRLHRVHEAVVKLMY